MTQAKQRKREPTAGSFKPGQSGNPTGLSKVSKTVIEAARAHTEECIAVLAECLASTDHATRIRAAEALLNRGWGKPTQPVEFDITKAPMELIEQKAREYLESKKGKP